MPWLAQSFLQLKEKQTQLQRGEPYLRSTIITILVLIAYFLGYGLDELVPTHVTAAVIGALWSAVTVLAVFKDHWQETRSSFWATLSSGVVGAIAAVIYLAYIPANMASLAVVMGLSLLLSQLLGFADRGRQVVSTLYANSDFFPFEYQCTMAQCHYADGRGIAWRYCRSARWLSFAYPACVKVCIVAEPNILRSITHRHYARMGNKNEPTGNIVKRNILDNTHRLRIQLSNSISDCKIRVFVISCVWPQITRETTTLLNRNNLCMGERVSTFQNRKILCI